jgi:hypothetical protein
VCQTPLPIAKHPLAKHPWSETEVGKSDDAGVGIRIQTF